MNFVTDDQNLEVNSVRTKKKALDFGNYSKDWETKRDKERDRQKIVRNYGKTWMYFLANSIWDNNESNFVNKFCAHYVLENLVSTIHSLDLLMKEGLLIGKVFIFNLEFQYCFRINDCNIQFILYSLRGAVWKNSHLFRSRNGVYRYNL